MKKKVSPKPRRAPAKSAATASARAAPKRAGDAPAWRKQRSRINGDWFKDAFRNQGITLSQVAMELGLHKSAVTLLLQGKRNLSLDEAGKIARIILKPLDEVLKNAGVESSAGVVGGGILVTGWVGPDMAVVAGTPDDKPRAPIPTGMGLGHSGLLRVLRMQTSGSKYEAMNGTLLYYIDSSGAGPAGLVAAAGEMGPTDSRSLGQILATLGKVSVVQTPKGVFVGVLKRSYVESRFDFYSITGDLLAPGTAVLAAHPIIWMKF